MNPAIKAITDIIAMRKAARKAAVRVKRKQANCPANAASLKEASPSVTPANDAPPLSETPKEPVTPTGTPESSVSLEDNSPAIETEESAEAPASKYKKKNKNRKKSGESGQLTEADVAS